MLSIELPSDTRADNPVPSKPPWAVQDTPWSRYLTALTDAQIDNPSVPFEQVLSVLYFLAGV